MKKDATREFEVLRDSYGRRVRLVVGARSGNLHISTEDDQGKDHATDCVGYDGGIAVYQPYLTPRQALRLGHALISWANAQDALD